MTHISQKETFRFQFESPHFFNDNEFKITMEGRLRINRLIEAIEQIEPLKLQLEIECHTNCIPEISGAKSNKWELSALRASNLAKYFIECGYNPLKIKANGYADLFPLAPEYDEQEKPLPGNMKKNNRIVMKFYL